jgi:rhamnose utilization protein RhaD (predicted bifunctional aldolase and dehydrogenase)
MSNSNEILNQLIAMSCELGRPENDYVVIAEGNTSAKVDDHSFWIKASGANLHQIGETGFVQVRFDVIQDMMSHTALSDDDVSKYLAAAKVDPTVRARPSTEASFHALCLTIAGGRFVGHTHATAVNAILCSKKASEALSGRMFPEEIAFIGRSPAFVPYADPGLKLSHAVRKSIEEYIVAWGKPPRVIYMQNHGVIVIGQTANEVIATKALVVKAARVLLMTYALGGPNFLSEADVERIDTRPDEHMRRNMNK